MRAHQADPGSGEQGLDPEAEILSDDEQNDQQDDADDDENSNQYRIAHGAFLAESLAAGSRKSDVDDS